MRRKLDVAGTVLVVLGFLAALSLAATASAQMGPAKYVGRFTLQSSVHWGKSTLQPGTYTVTIRSTGVPMIAVIRDSQGRAVTDVMTGARSSRTDGLNALLIREKDGQLRVCSLALSDLGIDLIFDRAPAQERPQEARFSQKVPVLWAAK
jgi:hypothetical protein